MKSTAKISLFILVLCCLAYMLSMFHRVCPAIISMDISKDLALDNSQMGMLSGAALLTYGIMQLPSGLLTDRFGGRNTLFGLLLLTSAGCLLFAFSGDYASSVAGRMITGVGIAITVPAMVVLAGCFSPETYGRASAAVLSSGGLGNILAATPLALAASAFGWRFSISFAAGLTLLLAFCILFFVKQEKTAPAKEAAPEKPGVLQGIREVLFDRRFLPIGLWGMCVMGTYFAMFSLWWGPYLMKGCALTKTEASLVMTTGAIFAMVSQPVIGWISDKVIHSRKIPVIIGSACGLAAALFMVFVPSPGLVACLALIVLFVLGTCSTSCLFYPMLRETFSIRLMGTASGLMGMLPPIWGTFVQKTYGFLLDCFGNDPSAFCWASLVVVFNAAIGLGASIALKESFGNTDAREQA